MNGFENALQQVPHTVLFNEPFAKPCQMHGSLNYVKLPMCMGSNRINGHDANVWSFWGISLITTHCFGWCRIVTF